MSNKSEYKGVRDIQEGRSTDVWCTPEMTCRYDVERQHGTAQQTLFTLDQIPDTMKKNKMPMGEKLMRHWFFLPVRAMTQTEKEGKTPYPTSHIDISMVKMEWVLSYRVARSACRDLVNLSYLTTPNAKSVLLKRIKQNLGGFAQGATSIPLSNVPALHQDWQFQFKQVGGALRDAGTLMLGADDLYAALANFCFYAAPASVIITALPGGNVRVQVPKVAIYVRDTYDFYNDPNGEDQYLGHWNSLDLWMAPSSKNFILSNNQFSVTLHSLYFPISNETFRQWQAIKGSGGDFIVFSDTKVEAVPENGIDFTLTAAEIHAI